MKTQLLEDIGDSGALPLAPSGTVDNSTAGKAVQSLAPAGSAQPARPRSVGGVWRQKPAGEALASAVLPAGEPAALALDKVVDELLGQQTAGATLASSTQPVEEPAPSELDQVFDEIAALEAQLVHPGQQHAPTGAAVTPQEALFASPTEPLHQPAKAPAEATPAPQPMFDTTVPQDPLFDFTAPLPEPQPAPPFTPAPAGLSRSWKRPLVWAACGISVALLAWGGQHIYQERRDAGSLALVANQAQAAPRAGSPLKEPTTAAAEATPEAAVPPLVMLERQPDPAVKPEPPPPLAATESEPPAAPKAQEDAGQLSASAPPKPSIRQARERSDAAERPVQERPRREPVRQVARASAVAPERPAAPDNSMSALLRACREHGYHATQCIKRQCSIGPYGFVCRGR